MHHYDWSIYFFVSALLHTLRFRRSKYKSRAQGGQKLASGKGGKPILQKQQQVPSNSAANNGQTAGSADRTGSRRSKWGNAPAAGTTTTEPPTTVRHFRRDAGSDRDLKVGANGHGDDNDHDDRLRQRDSTEGRNVGIGGGPSRGRTRRDEERGRDDDGRREKDLAWEGEQVRGVGGDHHKRPSARGDAANREDGRGHGGRKDSRDDKGRDRKGKSVDKGVRDRQDEGGRRDGTRHGRDTRDNDHSSKRSRRDDIREVDSRRGVGGDRGGGRSKHDSLRNASGTGKEERRAWESSGRGGERDASRKRSRSRSRGRGDRR